MTATHATLPSAVLTAELSPGVLLITLNRPDHLNAMNVELVEELHQVLARVRNDSTVRAIVLTGNGRAFCAGLDLKGYGIAPGDDGTEGRPQTGLRLQKHIADLHEAFRGVRAPIVAAINGPAVGGGMAMALLSDVRVMSTEAAFHPAFIKIGISGCDVGVSWLLPRLIGFSRASEILLTGRPVTATQALNIGLASSVHEPADVLDAALDTARTIAAHSPMGVWMTKEVLWSNLENPSFRAGIDLENRTQILCWLTEDHHEAVNAFLEKRTPVYRNR